jgi:hypothetical protein
VQTLLSVAETAASQVDMTFNTKNTVVNHCVLFKSLCRRSLRIADVFPFVLLAAVAYLGGGGARAP